MNYRPFLATLSACLALYTPLATAQLSTPEPDQLQVFLQGGPSAELQKLVEKHGGKITHDLHIIDAVGAELTPAQLQEVLKSPLVGRYFDDLSIAPPPGNEPPENEPNCDVGGSLELDISSNGIGWTLYNKQDTPARLERLRLAWPAELGAIKTISLGPDMLDVPANSDATAGSTVLEFKEASGKAAPALSGIQEIRIAFSAPGSQAQQQRDFELKAEFASDCSTTLIPGYNDNHENFHYNAVAGVEALHLNGITGSGVTVAVIDSGLWEDPALALDTKGNPRILARYDAINDALVDELFDASGHGTHMTSVIAHNGPTSHAGELTGTFKGVAPDARLVAVKAFDVAGQGDFLDIVRAVQWVVDNREAYNIRVLNLSFSARPRWHYWLDPINQAVMQAWASGITVVAAAGNDGPEPMTIGSPGNLPYVITVGAVTDSWTPENRDDDYIPDFSSRGPTPNAHIKPDLVAPGGHITGLTRPGSGLTREHPEYLLHTGEFVMSGSSQANALVSGIAALLLQLEPDLSPDDIKCKLMSSAEPAINKDGLLAYSPFQQGHGYANATRAVTLGQRGCGNAELDIQQEIAGNEHSKGPAIVKGDGSVSLPGLDGMISPDAATKGLSNSRKWGVKEHIERPTVTATPEATASPSPFDWMMLYLEEKSAIEKLSQANSR